MSAAEPARAPTAVAAVSRAGEEKKGEVLARPTHRRRGPATRCPVDHRSSPRATAAAAAGGGESVGGDAPAPGRGGVGARHVLVRSRRSRPDGHLRPWRAPVKARAPSSPCACPAAPSSRDTTVAPRRTTPRGGNPPPARGPDFCRPDRRQPSSRPTPSLDRREIAAPQMAPAPPTVATVTRSGACACWPRRTSPAHAGCSSACWRTPGRG